MPRSEVWDTLPSFRMWPKKTFFGLDQNKSYCFTLPKEVTERLIRFFSLSEGSLQREINFLIKDQVYPAEIRWVRINRSKPYRLKAEELPERDVIQFQWRKFENTQYAMRENLQAAFDLILSDEDNDQYSVTFHHAGDFSFVISFS